jgi:hypothetical protein
MDHSEGSQDIVVIIKDVKPVPFNVFVSWLYTEELPEHIDDWVRIGEITPHPSDSLDCGVDLIKIMLHGFADRFVFPKLRTDINRAIANKDINGNVCYPLNVIVFAFAKLPSNDPVLKYYLDANSRHWVKHSSWEDHVYESLPHDYLVRFMHKSSKIVQLLKTGQRIKIWNICKYHGHETNEEEQDCRNDMCEYSNHQRKGSLSERERSGRRPPVRLWTIVQGEGVV